MNWKAWVPLALAIVLGLVAMMVAKDAMDRRNGGQASRRFIEVVVARHDVPLGTALTSDDLDIDQIPGDTPPESVFRRIDEVTGRVVTAPLVKGQPVLVSLLAPTGTGRGLQALVPKGMRAITLEINEFSGLAGFLVPGCHVDIVATITERGELVSRTVVQNVKVTALGQRGQSVDGEATEPTRSVTLVVTPEQAEAIELASATGRPRLVLRSSGDDGAHLSHGVTIAELRGQPAFKTPDPFEAPTPVVMPIPAPTTNPVQVVQRDPAPPTTPQTRQRMVTVIRGGVESQVVFELPAPGEGRFMTDAKD
jgi:pilus assembly protein CpaB